MYDYENLITLNKVKNKLIIPNNWTTTMVYPPNSS